MEKLLLGDLFYLRHLLVLSITKLYTNGILFSDICNFLVMINLVLTFVNFSFIFCQGKNVSISVFSPLL